MGVLLWLDDYRNPFNNPEWLVFSPIPRSEISEIVWVKSYKEFTNWITNNGLPEAICFDHDLGDTLSGFDCAKWLVEYCLDNNKSLPQYNIQSANPVGKDNINSLLLSFIKFRE